MYTLGILTCSDAGARGEREDASGRAIREVLEAHGFEVRRYEVVPDDRDEIVHRLTRWSDEDGLDLIVTTGGTGLAPRDITPEATLQVAERVVPGIAEAMRVLTLKNTPMAMLSRGVCVIRGKTLILNLPGSTRGVRECLEAVLPALPHALEMLVGRRPSHPDHGRR